MKTLILLGVMLSLAALGGCTRAEKASVQQETRGLGQQVQNAALVAKVKTALATRKGLDATDIHVAAEGSMVTLTGDVSAREQATIAEQVAMGTAGVTAVK